MKDERLPEVKGLDLVPAPPEVAIASPYKPESKRLSLRVTNEGGGVRRLVVSVNDRKVATGPPRRCNQDRPDHRPTRRNAEASNA